MVHFADLFKQILSRLDGKRTSYVLQSKEKGADTLLKRLKSITFCFVDTEADIVES